MENDWTEVYASPHKPSARGVLHFWCGAFSSSIHSTCKFFIDALQHGFKLANVSFAATQPL